MAMAVRGGQVPGVIFPTDYAEVGVKPTAMTGSRPSSRARLQ